MGKTKISWANYTFNPWWGCVKVSSECDHCYAAEFSHRLGFKIWGKGSDRRFFSDEYWRQPEIWNRQAEKAGESRRVFAGSMCDLFEDAPMNWERSRLVSLIDRTLWLDWILLTKRPQNIGKMLPADWAPSNVWLGTTCGLPGSWWRVAELRKQAAAVRFLSCEPLLEDLRSVSLEGIHWVIAGAESGRGARPMQVDWVRRLRDQCQEQGVAFFYKQEIIHGIVVETPELDGRQWMEYPRPASRG